MARIVKFFILCWIFILNMDFSFGMRTGLSDEVFYTDTLPNPKKSDVLIRELPLSDHQKAALPGETRSVFPVDTSVKTGKLENGLSYYLRKLPPGARKWANCFLVVKTGSAMETEDQIGAALAVKHLVIKETEDLLESFPRFSSMDIGPDVSYNDIIKDFSGFEETIFEYSTPVSGIGQLGSALSILKSWASEAVLDPADFEVERFNILKSTPRKFGLRTILQNKAVFEGTRYGDRLPADLYASLKTLKPDAIKKFYMEWYRPDLMAVVIVGNIDLDEAEKELQKVFSGIKKPGTPIKNSPAFYVDNKAMKTVIVTDEQTTTADVQILFKFQKRPVRDQFGYRQLILNELINVMIQERFKTSTFNYAGNRESGILRPSGNTQFLYVHLNCQEGKVRDHLKPALLEIERLRKDGFTESELEKAKAYILQKPGEDNHLTEDALADVMSNKMLWHFLDGEPLLDVKQQLDLLNNYLPYIKLNEINKTFVQMIKEENGFILITGSSDAVGELSDEGQIKKIVDEVRIR